MKILTEGHRYELANFENPEKPGQVLQFIEKKKEVNPEEESKYIQDPELHARYINGISKLVTVNDGTTNEEVLAVLIDRLHGLNFKFPCRENSIAITHIETALLWLNKRTADRKARNVEGKALK